MEQTRKTLLRIADILQRKDISMTTLAKLCDMPISNLSGIVNNKRNPNMQTLDRIAQALNVPTWHLIQDPGILDSEAEQECRQLRTECEQLQQQVQQLQQQLQQACSASWPQEQTEPAQVSEKPATGLDYDLLTIDPLTGQTRRYRLLNP